MDINNLKTSNVTVKHGQLIAELYLLTSIIAPVLTYLIDHCPWDCETFATVTRPLNLRTRESRKRNTREELVHFASVRTPWMQQSCWIDKMPLMTTQVCIFHRFSEISSSNWTLNVIVFFLCNFQALSRTWCCLNT